MNFFGIFAVLLAVFASVLSAIYPDNVAEAAELREKREHGHGVTGPVHTFVKTDKHAHFKWGVRHNVGHHYAGK